MRRRIFLCLISFLFIKASGLYAQVDLNKGLVAYYPFNGNANDASGNNNNPVFNNATLASDRFGNPNSAYYFNGVDNYMRIPNAPSLNPVAQISTCAWVKPMGFNTDEYHENQMLVKGDNDFLPGNYLLRFGDAQYSNYTNCQNNVDKKHENFSTNFGGVAGGYTPFIVKDQWYLVIATYDGNTVKLFINCNLVASFPIKDFSLVNNYDLFFGKLNNPQHPYWLNGVMDDIRIYNRALTPDEVNVLGGCAVQNCDVVPDFSFIQSACNPLQLDFSNETDNVKVISWDFGNGQNSGSTNTPSVTYTKYGNYDVKLVVKAQPGCLDTVVKNIQVSVITDSLISTDTGLICNGNKLQLNARAGLDYCWQSIGGLSATNIANPVVSASKQTTFYLNARVTEKNLVVNGDFSQGNTGFVSAYNYTTFNLTEGEYFVGTNPQVWNISADVCNDHTEGKGNMLLMNGNPQTNVKVWSESIQIEQNTNYAFSLWIESIYPVNPAELQFFINGKTIGKIFKADLKSCNWQQFYIIWNSGKNTTADISIINKNTVLEGNDFALDDISFAKTYILHDSIIVNVDSISSQLTGDATICSGTSSQITGKVSVNATYNWFPVTGLNDTTLTSPTASPEVDTKYTLTAQSVYGCTISKSITIKVIPQPTVATIVDTSICAGTTIQLSTKASNSNTFSWTPATGLSNTTLQNPLSDVLKNTRYIITVNAGTLCTATDTVNITVNPLPVINAYGDTTLCAGASSQINAVAKGNVNYSWQPAEGLNDPMSNSPLATPTKTSLYNVQVIDSNKCTATAAVTITVVPKPVFAIAPIGKQICANDQLTLTASGGDKYTWYPAATVANPNEASTSVTPSVSTTYNVIIENNTCKLTDTLSSAIVVDDKITPFVSKTNDIDCVQGSATLHAAGGDSYKWMPDVNINLANTANPVVTPFQSTVFYVLISKGACTVTDSITVLVTKANVDKAYKMPSAFTPNSDRLNDCFGLKYWGGIKTLQFEVYNRWGNRLFYTTDPSKCWDGSYKGIMQPGGTYVYQIKAQTICGDIYKKGTVVLIR